MDLDKHQAALDGLRGFAAISVVLFHVGHWLDAPGLAPNSGMSVDLFFLLSGYVLTLAYAGRLDTTMRFQRFMVVRLVRLMPLVVLGTLISAVYAVMRLHAKHEAIDPAAIVTATLFGIVGLPYLTAPLAIGGSQVFPLNGPQYSLFLEIAANAVWAGFSWLRRVPPTVLGIAACLAVIALTGVLGGDTPDTFLMGFPRVGASFLGGVALFHLNRSLPPWHGWPAIFWLSCLGMLATFYMPVRMAFGGQLAWITILSPLLVLSGARTILTGRTRTLALLGGRLSYPIYVLHYPVFVWINGIFQTITHRQDAMFEGPVLVVTVLAGSYAALRLYDEPLRHRLSRWLRRGRVSTPA
jgi:peptidoglycan/LPS O-acetylase OafA/YrhL